MVCDDVASWLCEDDGVNVADAVRDCDEERVCVRDTVSDWLGEALCVDVCDDVGRADDVVVPLDDRLLVTVALPVRV